MNKFIIKTLDNTPVEDIHKAFNNAFSDYEVQIEMTLEKFREMMRARDINPDYSIGCFNNNRLIGFILTGYREIDGKKYAYDGGTGVIRDFRRKGIGEKLLGELIKFLKSKQFDYFVLEVLENNIPAINLYIKHGFEKIRRFECFELEKEKLQQKSGEFAFNHDISILEQLQLSDYSLFEQSWQNSFISIKNVIHNYQFSAIVTENNQVLAFGLIHKNRGDIPQIGILNEWKNKGQETTLISNLALFTSSNKILLLNIEENNYLGNILRQMNFYNFIKQFEMILKI